MLLPAHSIKNRPVQDYLARHRFRAPADYPHLDQADNLLSDHHLLAAGHLPADHLLARHQLADHHRSKRRKPSGDFRHSHRVCSTNDGRRSGHQLPELVRYPDSGPRLKDCPAPAAASGFLTGPVAPVPYTDNNLFMKKEAHRQRRNLPLARPFRRVIPVGRTLSPTRPGAKLSPA